MKEKALKLKVDSSVITVPVIKDQQVSHLLKVMKKMNMKEKMMNTGIIKRKSETIIQPHLQNPNILLEKKGFQTLLQNKTIKQSLLQDKIQEIFHNHLQNLPISQNIRILHQQKRANFLIFRNKII